MKKNIKTVVALLLVAAMALSMTACGDTTGNQAPAATAATAAPEYIYTAEYTKVDNPDNQWMGGSIFTEDGFYFSTQEKVGEEIPEGVTPEWEDQYAIWETVLYFVDYSGKRTKLDKYETLSNDTDHEFNSYINGIQAVSDGEIMLFETASEYWSDAPEGTEKYSDLWYEYYRSTNKYYIRIIDGKTGEVKKSNLLLIPEEIASPTDGSYFWPYGVIRDNDGNYVLVSEQKILGFDGDGNMTNCIELEGWAEKLSCLSDGRVVVMLWGDNGMAAKTVDLKSNSLGETIELPAHAYDAVPGNGDFDFYYNNGINFCGYNSKTKETKILFNWINCDVNNDKLSGFSVLADGTVVGITNTWDKNYENCTSEIVKMKSVPYDSVPHKEVITLATQYLDYDLRDVIINYNRSNPNYRIEVNDYSAFNTEEDWNAGLTKLNTEILAGNVPDLIDLNGLPYERFAAKGILEDLYPYLDADKELSRDDFFPNILNALEQNGKLCTTCSDFNIQAVMGASAVVGDTPGWTYDELMAAYAEMPEDCRIFDYSTTRYDVLRTGISLDVDSYCDWNTGKCSFDSEGFKNLLKFAASFPAEFNWENHEYSAEDEPYTLISQGRQMLLNVYLYKLENAGMYDAIFGEMGATYIGFPTENGTGNMLSLNTGYAMSSKCAHKDGAWEFLRTFFTEKYQTDTRYGIPTNLKAYDKMEKDAMTPEYATATDAKTNQVVFALDEDGNKIRLPKGSYYLSNSDRIEYYELSPEQAERIRELISTTTKFASQDSSIYDIVAEQAEAFFQGQKTVDDVVKLIQSKANIYINEQK